MGIFYFNRLSPLVQRNFLARLRRARSEVSPRKKQVVRKQNECDEDGGPPAHRYPLCFYFTHNRCRLMHEKLHRDMFSHTFPDLSVDPDLLRSAPKQPFSYYVVLNVVGKPEIVEMSAVLVDSTSLEVIDRFHRFVRPWNLQGKELLQNITERYGYWRIQSTWGANARDFKKTLKAFQRWLEYHKLWEQNSARTTLRDAAIVSYRAIETDKKICKQCKLLKLSVPSCLSEWIDLKYHLESYSIADQEAEREVMAIAGGLHMYEIGLDQVHNTTRLLQKMVCHGIVLSVSTRRNEETGYQDLLKTIE